MKDFQRYESPKWTVLGSVSELTQGTGTGFSDGGTDTQYKETGGSVRPEQIDVPARAEK